MGFTPHQNGTRPLQFTPGQLRDTVGLSVETFRLEGGVLIVDLPNGICRIAKDPPDARDILILCPLNPIIDELRDALLRSRPSANQRQLYFPPTEVGNRSRRSRA
jgi:hypothetical protein